MMRVIRFKDLWSILFYFHLTYLMKKKDLNFLYKRVVFTTHPNRFYGAFS